MSYVPVLILLIMGSVIGGVILTLTSLLGKGTPHPKKNMPFECGVPSVNTTIHRIPVRFYLVAILFLLFDIEIVFFYPWAIVYKTLLKQNSGVFFGMVMFVAVLLVGYFYALRNQVFDWE